jgi:hypothetical protein
VGGENFFCEGFVFCGNCKPMYISNPCVTSHDSRPKYIMLYYVLHYLLVSLFVVMNRCGVILWDLILAFFLTTFQLVCMWL